MKKHQVLLAIVSLGFTLAIMQIHAESPLSLGGPVDPAPPGPEFSGYLSPLFADNPAFTANLDFHSYGATSGNAVAVRGKLAYLNGKTRFEMDIASAGDANLPPQDAASLAQMGMNTMIAISCPDEKVDYFVYPDMMAFVRRPIPAAANYKLDVTQVGNENVQGQNCVKNKVVVTGPDGIPHESTVWSATDLNNFPIKIETVQNGATVVLLFRDLKLGAPNAAQFSPPADYKQFDDFRSMISSRAGTPAPR